MNAKHERERERGIQLVPPIRERKHQGNREWEIKDLTFCPTILAIRNSKSGCHVCRGALGRA